MTNDKKSKLAKPSNLPPMPGTSYPNRSIEVFHRGGKSIPTNMTVKEINELNKR